MPTRLIGASMGLAAFALAVFAGLAADNPADQILIRALISMLGCQAVGLAIGAVAERAIDDRAAAMRAENPIGGPAPEGGGDDEYEGPVLVV
ncbi:MAG: hypothetical protein IBJ10_10525 [Phycisphaerales bacterium]|nr:hypothetical protein [Phycisphaerales bacterium]